MATNNTTLCWYYLPIAREQLGYLEQLVSSDSLRLDEVRSSIDDLSSFVEKHTSGNFVSINGGLELGKLRKCYDEVKKISNSTYYGWPFYCDQNLNSAMSGKLLKARTQSGTSITRTAAPDKSAMHLSEPGDLTSIAMNAMAALARVPGMETCSF
ncbi:hypothetical protein IG631_22485 [Alternaria alternata]|nr:hypothetical protein IG631_22485 [Alternaria alternata]